MRPATVSTEVKIQKLRWITVGGIISEAGSASGDQPLMCSPKMQPCKRDEALGGDGAGCGAVGDRCSFKFACFQGVLAKCVSLQIPDSLSTSEVVEVSFDFHCLHFATKLPNTRPWDALLAPVLVRHPGNASENFSKRLRGQQCPHKSPRQHGHHHQIPIC